jgi:hypothetical protein
MEIRPPIETSMYGRKDKNMLMEKVRAIISESFEEGKIRN